MFVPAPGKTLLMPSGNPQSPDKLHLFFICTKPSCNDEYLLVNITTWTNPLCDDSCILNAGDHEFIRHKSWVVYRAARVESNATIIRGISDGRFRPHKPATQKVIAAIQRGLINSPHTPRKYKHFYRLIN